MFQFRNNRFLSARQEALACRASLSARQEALACRASLTIRQEALAKSGPLVCIFFILYIDYYIYYMMFARRFSLILSTFQKDKSGS
jgi:hypothetical protein